MRKKHEIDEEDKTLFRSTMRGVKPLSHTKITVQETLTPKLRKKKIEEHNPNPLNLFYREGEDEVSGDDMLEFHRGGLQHKVLRKLRRGQYNVEATLDMHGMRVTEAKEALNYFILHCLKNGIRHALIIHGKGHGTTKPALKNKLNQWLRQVDHVLAFCSATLQEGHTGAVYVLLKGSTSVDE
jgi:DNA-nicking Smr family endonuclease